MKVQGYHLAWLQAHPERDLDWLAAKIEEGFEIHHLDGNHANDDPSNLVLIEGVDHTRLHGWGIRLSFSTVETRRKATEARKLIPAEKRKAIAKRAARARWKKLSPQRRAEIARLGAQARWGKQGDQAPG